MTTPNGTFRLTTSAATQANAPLYFYWTITMAAVKSTNPNDRSPLKHLLAGGFSGVITTTLLHPLDLIKVRFQGMEGFEDRCKNGGQCTARNCAWLLSHVLILNYMCTVVPTAQNNSSTSSSARGNYSTRFPWVCIHQLVLCMWVQKSRWSHKNKWCKNHPN